MLATLAAGLILAQAGDPADGRLTREQAEAECADALPADRKSCVTMGMMSKAQRAAYVEALAKLLFGESYPWAPQILDLKDWTFETGTADQVVMGRPADGPPENPRVWQRVEYRVAQSLGIIQFKSSILLTEYDCHERRVRILQTSVYADNNFQGKSESNTPDAPKWMYVIPGSLGDTGMRKACTRQP